MKEVILSRLMQNTGEFIPGEMLGAGLNVSRTAVWKCVRKLKNEGYVIMSSSRKGYRLVSTPDLLNVCEISNYLNTDYIGRQIKHFDIIDSTNSAARKSAEEGCPEGTVVTAESQTSGRGRLGRQWSSPGKLGIWMSVVLKPLITPEEVRVITLAASVAVVAGIKNTTGIKTGIKWPNDIILDNRKVCGILTEMNSEIERVNFLILGIGLNVNQEQGDFPPELHNKAISLKMHAQRRGMAEAGFKRSMIAAGILSELEINYKKVKAGDTDDIIAGWKLHSVTLGKKVGLIAKNIEYRGVATDITRGGKLVISCNDGITREIVSGEVSVKGIMEDPEADMNDN